MIILRLLLLLTNLHLKLLSTQGTGADKLLSTQRVNTYFPSNNIHLDALMDWGSTWGMKFNAKKCNIMRVSRSRKPLQHFF